jgi:hypothetical protein
VLDLQGNSTRSGRDDGDALAQRLRDFDLEAFAEGELERNAGVREERVEELVGGRKADCGDSGAGQEGGDGRGREEGNGLVVDYGTFRVVDRAVAAACGFGS